MFYCIEWERAHIPLCIIARINDPGLLSSKHDYKTRKYQWLTINTSDKVPRGWYNYIVYDNMLGNNLREKY